MVASKCLITLKDGYPPQKDGSQRAPASRCDWARVTEPGVQEGREMPGEREGGSLLGEGTRDKHCKRKKTQSVFGKAALRALWAMARGLRPEAGRHLGPEGCWKNQNRILKV